MLKRQRWTETIVDMAMAQKLTGSQRPSIVMPLLVCLSRISQASMRPSLGSSLSYNMLIGAPSAYDLNAHYLT